MYYASACGDQTVEYLNVYEHPKIINHDSYRKRRIDSKRYNHGPEREGLA